MIKKNLDSAEPTTALRIAHQRRQMMPNTPASDPQSFFNIRLLTEERLLTTRDAGERVEQAYSSVRHVTHHSKKHTKLRRPPEFLDDIHDGRINDG